MNSRRKTVWVRKQGRAGLGWGAALFYRMFEKACDKMLF